MQNDGNNVLLVLFFKEKLIVIVIKMMYADTVLRDFQILFLIFLETLQIVLTHLTDGKAECLRLVH